MIEVLAKAAEVGEKAKEAKSSFDPDKRVEKSNSFAARQNEGFDPDKRVEKGEPYVGKAEVFDPDKRIEKSNSFTARQNEGFDPDRRVEKNESFDIKQRISFDPDKRVEKDDSFVDKREKVFDPDVKVEKRIPPDDNDDRIKVGWPPIRTPTTFPTISELDRGIKATEKNATNGDKSKESFNPDMKVAKADASDSKNREISRNKQNEGSVPDRNTEKKDTADSQKSEIPNDKPNGNLDSDKNTNKGDAEDSENKKTYPPNSTLEIDGKECKTDDNGEIYLIDGKLKPNCEYTLGGFKYKTDSKGRIINAQGDVKLPKSGRDQNPDIKSKDKKPDDDKGHIIGHQLGGTETEGNLVPQNKVLNRGEYNKLEKQLAKLKAEGHDVKVDVTLKYKGDSDRPDSFRVKYTVDGKTYVKTFKNEAPQNGGNK